MKHCFNEDGQYIGKASERIIQRNGWRTQADGMQIVIQPDQSIAEKPSPDDGDLLLSDRPSDDHINKEGEWYFPEQNPPNNSAQNADEAFMRLIGSFTIKASYPAKQDAMEKAVGQLGEAAAVDELFNAAVKMLD